MIDCQDEQRLILALVNGDAEAWSEFVNRFQGLICARVQRTANECQMQLDRSEVEDLAADVFAGLVADDCATLRRFEGRSSLATWLAVITRRLALRRLTARVSHSPLTDADAAAAQEAGEPDLLLQLIRAEDRQRLHAMLAELNEGDQMILRMFYLDGLSYREIAQRLDLAVNTIGPKLQRAQQRLRVRLETSPVHRPPSSTSNSSNRQS